MLWGGITLAVVLAAFPFLMRMQWGLEALVGALVLLLVWIFVRSPERAAMLALIFATMTIPSLIPTQLSLHGFTLRLFEPFLGLALLRAVTLDRVTRQARALVLVLGFVVLLGGVVGWAEGHSLDRVVFDVHPVVLMVVCAFVANSVMVELEAKAWGKVIGLILWVSLVLVLLASVAHVSLNAHVSAASLDPALGGDAATRVQTPTSSLAFAVVAAAVAVAASGRVRREAVRWWLVAPAVGILMLGFARNQLVGIALAGVAGALAVGISRGLPRLVRLSETVALVVIPLAALTVFTLTALPSDNWLRSQVDSYSSRVVGGFGSGVLARDESFQYRVDENKLLNQQWPESPFIGHGFGYAFRPSEGGPGTFKYDIAPLYAHNYYLWLLVKTGLLGLAGFLAALVIGIRNGLRGEHAVPWAAGTTLVAFGVVSLVTPIANGIPSSCVFGACLGVALAGAKTSSAEPRDGRGAPDREFDGNAAVLG